MQFVSYLLLSNSFIYFLLSNLFIYFLFTNYIYSCSYKRREKLLGFKSSNAARHIKFIHSDIPYNKESEITRKRSKLFIIYIYIYIYIYLLIKL